MATTWVLKLTQVDLPDQPILVHITSRAENALDLDLLATDGDAAYRGKVRRRNAAKLKAPNYDGTDKEWEEILKFGLYLRSDSSVETIQHRGLEIQCSILDGDSEPILYITFRTRIENITHRLGAIELPLSSDTDDVDLFGWACQAVDQRESNAVQLAASLEKADIATETISNLEKQLADLVKAKSEHEDQLLTKFAMLLNEKKERIRNQQRILQTAKLDQHKLSDLHLTMKGEQTGSQTKKRTRNQARASISSENDESDGFEAMDVDGNAKGSGNEGSADEGHTTDATETASEDDADPNQRVPASRNARADSNKAASTLPPTRALPFQKKAHHESEPVKSRSSIISNAPQANDEETASEDDEL